MSELLVTSEGPFAIALFLAGPEATRHDLSGGRETGRGTVRRIERGHWGLWKAASGSIRIQ